MTENLPRILPDGLKAVIKKGSWQRHKIFDIIQEQGKISNKEMYRTFNMGIGFVLVVNQRISQAIIKRLNSLGEKAFEIGYIEEGERRVEYLPP
jgi:phosphoribosylformylglycinamidine cyclo-ligase